MFKALNAYGAMNAKVRAMYGKLMTESEWHAVMNLKEAPPGFSAETVRAKLKDEYERLCKFASREDKKFLSLFPPDAQNNSYYIEAFSYLKKRYNGLDKKRLISFIGAEADLLNIIHLLRMVKSFPMSLRSGDYDRYLIPVGESLTKQFINELRAAASFEDAVDILKRSKWSRYFNTISSRNFEREYERFMEKFCKKLIYNPVPNAGMPHAYLLLKKLECERLIRTMEAIRSGVNPAAVL